MSLWGSMHRHLEGVLQLPLASNPNIVPSGNLTMADDPCSKHHCHMFSAAELRAFLDHPGLKLLCMLASSALATGFDMSLAEEPDRWEALVDFEQAACQEDGLLDAGTHLIAVVRHA